MCTMTSQINSLTIVYSTVYSGVDKKNIKAPRHWPFVRRIHRPPVKAPRYWPLCGEFSPVAGEFPAQMASNAENVSIWWRHHDTVLSGCDYISLPQTMLLYYFCCSIDLYIVCCKTKTIAVKQLPNDINTMMSRTSLIEWRNWGYQRTTRKMSLKFISMWE